MANKLIEKIVSRLDNDAAYKFADINTFAEQKNWISTGNPILDYRLKTLGYPTGIIEVRGSSQSGKTTFSLHAAKSIVQSYKERAIPVILSSERRDNRELALQMGVPIDDIIIVNTRTIEGVFNEMMRIIDQTNEIFSKENIDGKPRFLFIWDSLGNTISSQEVKALKTRKDATNDKDEDKHAAMGSAARAISIGLRGTMALLDDNDVTLFIINRAYDHMNSPGKSSYGGKAIEFYPNLRLELARKEGVKVGETEVGQITKVTTIKTDFDRPKQSFDVEIGYGLGFVLGQKDIELCIELGILSKNGQFGAKFSDKLKWTSRRQMYEFYENNSPMLKVLMMKLQKELSEKTLQERSK